MAMSSEALKKYTKRLLMARSRLLCNSPFYGLLLMHMRYAIDELCDTAYTDGYKIAFSPKFMDDLSDSELDFVLMHEILHVALLHCTRGIKYDNDIFNIACDIVVNSNILKSNDMKISTITLKKYGEAMHKAPDGKEGYEYDAEQVYEMLIKKMKHKPKSGGGGNSPKSDGPDDGSKDNKNGSSGGFAHGRARQEKGNAHSGGSFDDHTHWEVDEESEELRDVWVKRLSDVSQVVTILESSSDRGTMPACAERLLSKLRKAQNDWRTILNEFIQVEICDYSFSPPDRRFSDSPFFLPDFNGTEEKAQKVLFMIDTSGSISDNDLALAFSEICGAVEQFDGQLEGYIGFFDAAIYEPVPFASVEDVLKTRPLGGGGTDFQIIFEYVDKHMEDDPPSSIIILTDGCAPFPKEHLANGIPVLWVINNETVNPPWGKVARIDSKK
ncbi:MAG: hypothetical protein IKB27_02100 [Clostridia bacterium]|nr:hypothetical protein [Clostridia bacterium]